MSIDRTMPITVDPANLAMNRPSAWKTWTAPNSGSSTKTRSVWYMATATASFMTLSPNTSE